MMMKKCYVLAMALAICGTSVQGQQSMTREQILSMSMEELGELPLEDLMQAIDVLGVSSVDELFAMIMNKNVSSASKKEEDCFTSPLASTVITKEEMRSYGVSTIEEAFRLIPGVIVMQKTNGVYDIHLRGLNNIPDNNMLLYTENNNTLLMVDGRVVQNFVTGAVMMDKLPVGIEDVERIEVIRGACAALYGMNAVTGVINIITEKPTKESKSVSGSLQIGNQNTYVMDMGYRQTVGDKWSFGITANGQRRERDTDKLYVPASSNLYRVDGDEYTAITNGGFYTLDEIANELAVGQNLTNITTGTTETEYCNLIEDGVSLINMFPEAQMSRRNIAMNGYVRYGGDAVRVDLSGGYQSSFVNTTSTLRQDYFSYNGQQSKTWYVNLDAGVKDLHFQGAYTGGPQNFAYGVEGYKMKTNNVNLQADYDIEVGDFGIRPGVSWLYLKYEDYDEGLLGGSAELSTISPSVRLDWRHNGWRAVVGVRGDKTSKPDTWNVSWQGEFSKEIGDKHFIRAVYGRAYRAPNMINTSADFAASRAGMADPEELRYVGDDSADLMKIDNFELGYRVRPTSAWLLDAEVFYSHSSDYGALMSSESAYMTTTSQFATIYQNILTQVATGAVSMSDIAYTAFSSLNTYSDLVYRNLPYIVHQFGVSLNVDYIVSSKLILKLNANFQHTFINDYFVYNQRASIEEQLHDKSSATTQACVAELISGISNTSYYRVDETGSYYSLYQQEAFAKANVDDFKATYGYDSWGSDAQSAFLTDLLDSWNADVAAGGNGQNLTFTVTKENGETQTMTVERPLTMYYALRYSVAMDTETGEFTIGNSSYTEPEHRDNHKHKATPAVYGMIGAIYKPIKDLTISAYCNYIGKRTYNTVSSSELESSGLTGYKKDNELKAKFTLNLKVGYKPTSNVEVFLNANNLLNSKEKEFVYADKVGGLYSVGMNFKF